MTPDFWLQVAGPIVAPIVTALAGFLILQLTGLIDRLRDYLIQRGHAQAASIVASANLSIQAAMQNAAGQVALEVQQGTLSLNDYPTLQQRLTELEDGIRRKLPQAIATLQPANNAILEGIRGKITAALPIPDPAPTAATPIAMPAPVTVMTPPGPDRRQFFDAVRAAIFNGRMVQSQVDGCEKILNYWIDTMPTGDTRHLAYILATTTWETNHTMQPVEEIGRGAGRFYGPTGFYGRGLVQLTLKPNYRRMSAVAGCDLVANPARALQWPIALRILFAGMCQGMFTGRKLSDFFNANTNDPIGARGIVNGSDRASEIAALHAAYYQALDDVAGNQALAA